VDTITNDISVNSFEEMVEYLEATARRNPMGPATTNVDSLGIEFQAESKVEEAVAMLRLNGGAVVYTRTTDEHRVYWKRMKVQATNALTAWFFRELVELHKSL